MSGVVRVLGDVIGGGNLDPSCSKRKDLYDPERKPLERLWCGNRK